MHVRFPSCNYYQYPEISTIDAKLLPILFSMYFLFFFLTDKSKITLSCTITLTWLLSF